jgi:hypothetical protein
MPDSSGHFVTNPLLGPKRPRIFFNTSQPARSVRDPIRMAMDELRVVMHLLCMDD